jgi:hypothetical protein
MGRIVVVVVAVAVDSCACRDVAGGEGGSEQQRCVRTPIMAENDLN